MAKAARFPAPMAEITWLRQLQPSSFPKGLVSSNAPAP